MMPNFTNLNALQRFQQPQGIQGGPGIGGPFHAPYGLPPSQGTPGMGGPFQAPYQAQPAPVGAPGTGIGTLPPWQLQGGPGTGTGTLPPPQLQGTPGIGPGSFPGGGFDPRFSNLAALRGMMPQQYQMA